MPWLPMYLTESDAALVIGMLSEDSEIACLTADGPGRWRAVEAIRSDATGRIGLWHVPSGALPLLPAVHGELIGLVQDPWRGWTGARAGADPGTPYFGAGHPGVIWLNLHTGGLDAGSCCGLSSFEWISNTYHAIGNPAAPVTEKWWKSLRRRVARLGRKVPRQRLCGPLPPEVFAFPGVYALLAAGRAADTNPLISVPGPP